MYRGCRACIYGGYTPSQRHKIYKDKVKQGLTYKGIADKVIDEEELKVGTTHEVDTKDIYADTLAKVG